MLQLRKWTRNKKNLTLGPFVHVLFASASFRRNHLVSKNIIIIFIINKRKWITKDLPMAQETDVMRLLGLCAPRRCWQRLVCRWVGMSLVDAVVVVVVVVTVSNKYKNKHVKNIPRAQETSTSLGPFLGSSSSLAAVGLSLGWFVVGLGDRR
jgi:hypothetical protein